MAGKVTQNSLKMFIAVNSAIVENYIMKKVGTNSPCLKQMVQALAPSTEVNTLRTGDADLRF